MWEGGCALTPHLKKSLALGHQIFFLGKNWEICLKNGIFLKLFGQPSRFSQICSKFSCEFLNPPSPKLFLRALHPQDF